MHRELHGLPLLQLPRSSGSNASMSEYLPSFIVEPVLRQARRFSERIGSEENPAGPSGSSFSLPAVPDFQRFYPSRFWTQSPSANAVSGPHGLVDPALVHDDVPEESTLRSIARNIQLWASQINNLDIEEEAIQEPILPSVEDVNATLVSNDAIFTEEPEHAELDTEVQQLPSPSANRETGARSLPLLNRFPSNSNRTNSETSVNPAHELSNRSQVLEHNAQTRSRSVPFASFNPPDVAGSTVHAMSTNNYEDNPYSRLRNGSGVLPEDDGMKPLRQKINAVWAGPGTAQQKSHLVHALMTERYRSSHKESTPTSSATAMSPPFRATSPLSLASIKSEEVDYNLSPFALVPTYAPLHPGDISDEITGEMPKPDLGCIHYKRNVKMQCATCERWYTCRVCHDENENHQLPRSETKHMLCMICNTPQQAAQVCKACHIQAAYYYCGICKLWNNDLNKSIYHCDDCGICRLGQGLGKDFFHCKTCAACMSIAAESTHRCIEKSTKCDCPICGEYMFTSPIPVTFMRCGHSIHETCFEEWCNTSYKCPICSKSIANMESQFRRLDRHIEEQPMPDEYSHNRAYVFCNDCNSRSIVKYHWLGLKCAVCDSYNTAQLELLGPESPVMQERAGRAQEMGVGEASITASQSHTPNNGLLSPASLASPDHLMPLSTDSLTRQRSLSGTPHSAIAAPGRRDSPFRNLPHSPTRSHRAMSPVIGSYFGTGQRAPPTENRRNSYFSVLSFSNTAEAPPAPAPPPSSSLNQPTTQSSKSHLSPPSLATHTNPIPNFNPPPPDDDDDMDFWGGHSPRSHDADIVKLDLDAEEEEEEEASSDDDDDDDEDEAMGYDEDEDEDEDPLDLLIGHR